MSDDLVKRLRETTHMYQVDCELKMKCADRIEELEDMLNFLIQPDMLSPDLSYRGWVIRDEDNGYYWQAYNYNWDATEWESQDFISMAGNLDDVIEAIDRRIAKLTGGKDE